MDTIVLATVCARYYDVRRVFGTPKRTARDVWKLNGSLYLQPRSLAAAHSPRAWCEWVFVGPPTDPQKFNVAALRGALVSECRALILLPDGVTYHAVWPTWVEGKSGGPWWEARAGELVCAIGEEVAAWALPLVIEPARIAPR